MKEKPSPANEGELNRSLKKGPDADVASTALDPMQDAPARRSDRHRAHRRRLVQAVDGDRARWQGLVAERLRGRGLLLPYGQALLRALALAAIDGAGDRSARRRLADRALDQLRVEQAHEEAEGAPWDTHRAGAFHRWVARRFALEPAQARRACILLNARPRDERLAFLADEPGSDPWRRMRAAVRDSARAARDAPDATGGPTEG